MLFHLIVRSTDLCYLREKRILGVVSVRLSDSILFSLAKLLCLFVVGLSRLAEFVSFGLFGIFHLSLGFSDDFYFCYSSCFPRFSDVACFSIIVCIIPLVAGCNRSLYLRWYLADCTLFREFMLSVGTLSLITSNFCSWSLRCIFTIRKRVAKFLVQHLLGHVPYIFFLHDTPRKNPKPVRSIRYFAFIGRIFTFLSNS